MVPEGAMLLGEAAGNGEECLFLLLSPRNSLRSGPAEAFRPSPADLRCGPDACHTDGIGPAIENANECHFFADVLCSLRVLFRLPLRPTSIRKFFPSLSKTKFSRPVHRNLV